MKRFFVICSVGFAAMTSEARLYNYEDLPVGVRSFGMGNTGMADSEDVGAVYYNPAVLSWSEGDQLSATVSAYSRIDTRTGEYVSLFESAADNIRRGGFLSVPTMVGGFFSQDKWTWGGAVLVPNAFVNSGSEVLATDSTVNFESSFQDIWINAFGAYRLNEKTSLGLGVFYVSRSSSEKFSFLDKTSGTLATQFVERMWDVNGFTAILGLSRKNSEAFTWGVSIRLPVVKFGGIGRISDVRSGATDLNVAEFEPSSYPMPLRLSGGVAYSWNERSSLAFDLHLYAPLLTKLHSSGRADLTVKLRMVPSLHFGYEHYFRKSLGLRLGYFTNISAAREVPKGLSAMHDKVNMYGATGALVFAKESGEVSLGGWAQGGQGRSFTLDPAKTGDVPRSNYFYGGVIASTYRF